VKTDRKITRERILCQPPLRLHRYCKRATTSRPCGPATRTSLAGLRRRRPRSPSRQADRDGRIHRCTGDGGHSNRARLRGVGDYGQPAGALPRLNRLTRELLARLSAINRPQALLFAMHGAQTAESVDDAEGYFLCKRGKRWDPISPSSVTLDLHANVTRAMVANASAIVGYQTYPHNRHV